MNICVVSECGRAKYQGGDTCNTHTKRRLKGDKDWDRPIRAKVPNGSTALRNSSGEKLCTQCKTWLPLESYSTAEGSGSADGYMSTCRFCRRERDLISKYKITQQMYDAKLAAQGGGCGICGILPDDDKKPFTVDHDHSCCPGTSTCGNCVRGILCNNCNLKIGWYDANKEGINGYLHP